MLSTFHLIWEAPESCPEWAKKKSTRGKDSVLTCLTAYSNGLTKSVVESHALYIALYDHNSNHPKDPIKRLAGAAAREFIVARFALGRLESKVNELVRGHNTLQEEAEAFQKNVTTEFAGIRNELNELHDALATVRKSEKQNSETPLNHKDSGALTKDTLSHNRRNMSRLPGAGEGSSPKLRSINKSKNKPIEDEDEGSPMTLRSSIAVTPTQTSDEEWVATSNTGKKRSRKTSDEGEFEVGEGPPLKRRHCRPKPWSSPEQVSPNGSAAEHDHASNDWWTQPHPESVETILKKDSTRYHKLSPDQLANTSRRFLWNLVRNKSSKQVKGTMNKITPVTHPTAREIVNQYAQDNYFPPGSVVKVASGTETKPGLILDEMSKNLRNEIRLVKRDKRLLILPIPGWAFPPCGINCERAIEVCNRRNTQVKYPSKNMMVHDETAHCSCQCETHVADLLEAKEGLYLF